MLPSRMTTLAILCAAPLLSAERCGPATSLEPAYVRGAVVADDALVGSYVTVNADPEPKKKPRTFPAATIARDDTDDGPSYLLTLAGDKAFVNVALRMFVFDIGGQRFADVVAEDRSKDGELAKSLALPQHVLCKLRHNAGGGVTLETLQAKWLDAEAQKDPRTLPMRSPPRRYRQALDGGEIAEREPVLIADTATLQKLLARAAPLADAWDVGLELVRKGSPVLRFTLTSEERVVGVDANDSIEHFSVAGSAVEVTRSTPTSGAAVAPPSVARGAIADPQAVDALVRAIRAAKTSKGKKPLAPNTRIRRICLDEGTQRCIDRALDDDSGTDFAAMIALREALRATVATPAKP